MKFLTILIFTIFAIFGGAVFAAEDNEPEIVYIQYSTPEEAEMAQKKILEQYDALGGTAIKAEGDDISPLIAVDTIKPAETTPVVASAAAVQDSKLTETSSTTTPPEEITSEKIPSTPKPKE